MLSIEFEDHLHPGPVPDKDGLFDSHPLQEQGTVLCIRIDAGTVPLVFTGRETVTRVFPEENPAGAGKMQDELLPCLHSTE
jgi:hypothetical protein